MVYPIALIKSSQAVKFTVGMDNLKLSNINNIDVVLTLTFFTRPEREAKEQEIVGQDEPTPLY